MAVLGALAFGLAIFAAALLLFAVQPMTGRLVLPTLGGSPAVWNTVMVFFQAALLTGYALAHLLTRLPVRWQVASHAALVVGAAATLPIGFGAATPPADTMPVGWLLGALSLGVGLPALMLATVSPLVQVWYARSGLPRARDPYFLYAASNAGSLLGLLGVPLLLDPRLGLAEQRTAWSIGFLALGAALVLVWWRVWWRGSWRMRAVRSAKPTQIGDDARAAMHGSRRPWIWWIVLALVPSSLLLGVTQHLTTDIAAVPLLWVVPLALYLLTFIVAFGVRGAWLGRVAAKLTPIAVVAVVVAVLVEARHPLFAVALIHLVAFVVIALACHARLASLRPPVSELTRFYLCVSLGGVLGGSVNALAAPWLLDWVAEYPIMLALGGMLAVGLPAFDREGLRNAVPGVLATVGVGVLLVAPIAWTGISGGAFVALFIGVVALVCYLLSKRPLAFGIALLAVLLLPPVLAPDADIARRDRTFFGVHTVFRESFDTERGSPALRHVLRHGGTVHGLQNLGDNTPWTYYHPIGPLGEVMTHAHSRRRPLRIGAVGLGVGSLAAYTEPGDLLTFFEIDPVVVDIAQDASLFTFVEESPGAVEYVVGDGRLTIAGRGPFDLIVLDAFSSDAIPVHLLTAEAFETYASELAEGGVIALHASNRHLRLGPVIAATAEAAGLTGLIVTDEPLPAMMELGQQVSTWAVLAPEPAALRGSFRGWEPLVSLPGDRPWTDDYASILGVLRLD
ncbi:MAG: fused MFS/spermidine synthase [Planctomycetota bacterium]